MKFGQLTEYDMKNIFLQKLYKKSGSETSFRPVFAFLKKLYTRIKQVPSTFISFSYICTTNHMFERAIWDKLLECIFQNFEIAQVKRGQFQNFQKPRG